ncbi:predicted protein [Sclerotinia sclerotiorum 1980 UF-70]|uniref:Uncharacterized protein n=1 Tax=Sclerotinia sclerotiorum (strain ATCC 18683 / 1980 / Ss-1) TaxID=665079 RepID=A7EM10_SCLS1|nr:predicted protein [Sclerotinia sclerotiorum 1980 UF-70]EDO03876.1 predicted protein [Sclerotinia sclerotiorum 1980 UF-70]
MWVSIFAPLVSRAYTQHSHSVHFHKLSKLGDDNLRYREKQNLNTKFIIANY